MKLNEDNSALLESLIDDVTIVGDRQGKVKHVLLSSRLYASAKFKHKKAVKEAGYWRDKFDESRVKLHETNERCAKLIDDLSNEVESCKIYKGLCVALVFALLISWV